MGELERYKRLEEIALQRASKELQKERDLRMAQAQARSAFGAYPFAVPQTGLRGLYEQAYRPGRVVGVDLPDKLGIEPKEKPKVKVTKDPHMIYDPIYDRDIRDPRAPVRIHLQDETDKWLKDVLK
jgi:hypothetical protein